MGTDAQKRAQKKYDENNKDRYKSLYLKLNVESDRDILNKLESVTNKQGYIKELIRNDIQ